MGAILMCLPSCLPERTTMNADMQEDSPDTYALAAPFPVEAAAAAVNELAERGLQVASKWLAELLLSLDSDSQPIAIPPSAQKSVRVSLAQRYLACREYKECARLLEHEQGPLAKWLWLYSRYLVSCFHAPLTRPRAKEDIR